MGLGYYRVYHMGSMNLSAAAIAEAATAFLAMLLSLTIHEAAHAWMAKKRGDTTAEREGRLTLNPLAHIDPLGTVILPIVGALTQLPVIGWAKPVPVDLRNVKNPKWDHVLIAFAGPGSNLLLSILAAIAVAFYGAFLKDFVPEGHFLFPLVKLASVMVWVNAFLAFFNLLPLPPLDGSTVFSAFLPDRWARKYEEVIAPYGYFILLLLIVAGGLRWLPPLAAAYVGAVRFAVESVL